MSTQRRATLRIQGTVQGVSFRESSRAEALRLGLSGWVRNRSDGSVEATVEGEPAALEDFVSWCHQGPRTARVTHVARTDGEATGEFRTFTVERTS
ncbi:acylphosphatase [Corallococcus praedator]|uniref:Acylphosphatase n=1 Tax=Corallococcus praedator TaxID=2316724 RepID=A0ABX9QMR2_9BACT|nr:MULTISPECIES: acylphosphatase [Corallococcus]RKH17557.1 acylphosphatase [Corallococcus sp. CA047B]RKH22931.1 acylphosphatase [Corallococcus sp. CA031C]RKI12392.1 acylphosphatase [Corallococcus praedator]